MISEESFQQIILKPFIDLTKYEWQSNLYPSFDYLVRFLKSDYCQYDVIRFKYQGCEYELHREVNLFQERTREYLLIKK